MKRPGEVGTPPFEKVPERGGPRCPCPAPAEAAARSPAAAHACAGGGSAAPQRPSATARPVHLSPEPSPDGPGTMRRVSAWWPRRREGAGGDWAASGRARPPAPCRRGQGSLAGKLGGKGSGLGRGVSQAAAVA